MSEAEILQLQKWLHEVEEGTLGDADKAALEALLLRDEEVRRLYVQRMSMGAALCKMADEAQEAEPREAETAVPFAPAPGPPVRSWPLSAKLALAGALAACVAVMALSLLHTSHARHPIAETSDAGCAVLVDAAGAQWAPGSVAWQVGMSVPAGKLGLTSGLARLEFYSGASVTLEGSSELEIVSVNEAKCRYGQMRVHVPPHARGFKLTTPDAEVIDLGTEFGLKVSEAGRAEVHVFDGEVEVLPNEAKSKLSVKEGAGWDAEKGVSASPASAASTFADLTAFLTYVNAIPNLRTQYKLVGFTHGKVVVTGFEP